MTAASDILNAADQAGIRLSLGTDGNLKCSGDQGTIARWLPELRQHKAELTALLASAANDARPDPDPDPHLSPDDLAIAHALLTHWQEDDPDTRREWLDGLARDPARLEGMRQMALAAGVARYETPAPAPTPDPEPPKAFCARCRHWTPDTINPPGGRGRCLCDAPASHRPGSCWPWTHEEAALTCYEFDPKTPREEPR